MSRALVILAAGIGVAVLVAVAITPIPFLRTVLVPVLVTTALGVLVMAVVARRSRIRQREQDLREQHTTRTPQAPDVQEPGRG